MDDEDVVRTVAGKMLEFLGYSATLTRNGEEAVQAFKTHRDQGRPFDGVILDLVVPGGMGGAETLEKLLAIDPGVKAFISSGYGDSTPEGEAIGNAGVIAKPYELKTLGAILDKALGK